VNEVEYKAAIQGHYAILDETNPERRRSLSASRHYSDYEIADAVVFKSGGKRKGIKLKAEGVKVIEAFIERIDSKPASDRSSKKLSSVRITRDDKSLLEQIFQQLELDESLNQSSKMNELLTWVKARLEAEPNLLESESENSVTNQIHPQVQPLQGELEFEPITPDDPQEQITVAANSPNETFEIASPEIFPQESSPIFTASSLETKIDKLVDVMTVFINLQIQGATRQSNHQPSKVKVNVATQAQSTTAISAQSHKTDETTSQRTPRNSPIAEAAINNAINAIIAHNNATKLHDLKWAISINAVKELVSDVTKSQRLVDKAIALRKDEIEAHHTLHQIEPLHNHRHKRKRTISQAILFPSVSFSSL